MTRHTLSVLVENKPGVLVRIAGLFSRRGFNIDSLAVGVTEHPDISRITIVVNVQEGVVQLRGEVPDMQMLEAIVAKAADVHGIRDVENLLHLPGVPASMHQ